MVATILSCISIASYIAIYIATVASYSFTDSLQLRFDCSRSSYENRNYSKPASYSYVAIYYVSH